MHHPKKMFAIKTFYFRVGEAILENLTSHPHGGGGRGVTLIFQMGTSVFYCKFRFSIKNFFINLKFN